MQPNITQTSILYVQTNLSLSMYKHLIQSRQILHVFKQFTFLNQLSDWFHFRRDTYLLYLFPMENQHSFHFCLTPISCFYFLGTM